MNKGAHELWVNAICAVVKSDHKIHDEEIENIGIQLRSKKQLLIEFGIETDELFIETMFKLRDNAIDAEEHFQIVKNLMRCFNVEELKTSLHVLLEVCISIAYGVNQLNKKELVMLSRLEQQFKKF
jgi:hypothetical protein